MRELDLLLEKFLATEFDSLDQAELGALELLLNQPDQDILAWLTASREPPRKLAGIVSHVRRSVNA